MKEIIDFIKSLFTHKKEYLQLRSFQVFKDLNYYELHLLSKLLHNRIYEQGETLFEKNYPLEVIFFIDTGEIEVEGYMHQSNKVTLKKHQFLGIIDMYYDVYRSCSAKAIKQSSVLTISCMDFKNFINQNPKAGVKILTRVCQVLSRFLFHQNEIPVEH